MLQSLSSPQLQHSPASALLGRVFAALDDAGVAYCVLHGYGEFPNRVEGDVDCLMDANWLPARLARLLHDRRRELNAQVVQWFSGQSHFIVLAGTNEATGEIYFLHLHVSSDVDLARRRIYDGRVILESRRRHGQFWIPSARHEFACTLARRIVKRSFTQDHLNHLRALLAIDPAGCARQAEQLLGSANTVGLFDSVPSNLPATRTRLLMRAALRRPVAMARNLVVGAARVMGRFIAADRGMNLVILGPDGSGKSSVVESMRQDLAGAFVGSQRRTFPPALLNRKATVSNSTPHAVTSRSWTSSVARAIGYWFAYYTAGHYFTIHPAKAAGKLVIHDRHLLDCLVDPKRYRYGGPMGLLRGIVRFIHKPDLVMLLDAPAAVIQSRKQEVTVDETARQLREYRDLLNNMPNGVVVDVNRPLSQVVDSGNQQIMQFLARRVARRFAGVDADASWMRPLLSLHAPDARVIHPSRDLNAQIRRYAILPSRRKARWFIPLDSGAIAAAGLGLATPTKRAARWVHAVMRAAARAGAPVWYRDQVCIAQSSIGSVERVFQQFFPDRVIRLAITLGSPPPARNRKISLAAIDERGTVLAFAKLPGESEASHRSVIAEADALRQLESTGIGAPRLLWAGEVNGRYMTVAEPMTGRTAGLKLESAHQTFLACLRQSEIKCAADTAFAGVLRERANLVDGEERDILNRVLLRLTAMQLPRTIVHGDFAPWNLRISDGQLRAFDWEYAQFDGLPLIDEIHHILAVGYLVKRWPAARAVERLCHHAASQPLGYAADVVRTLQCVYLLEYMLRLRSEGYESDYARYAWCREVLIELSAEGGAA